MRDPGFGNSELKPGPISTSIVSYHGLLPNLLIQTMRRSLLRLAEHAHHGASGGVGSQPHVHPPQKWIYYSAVGLGASTWFYLLYMAKNEGPVLLV
jgi:hypothetical protein